MRRFLLRLSTHAYRGLLDSELRSLLVSSEVSKTDKSANPNKVIWNETLGEFITVGAMGIIETSPTGRRWTRIPVSTTSTLNSIVWNKDLKHYVIVGNEGVILTSPDGYSWQIESSKLSDNLTVLLGVII